MLLAFLNLGASEIALILLLLLLLFGADKLPELARSVGRARAQLESAKSQVTDALKTEEEKARDGQFTFERERERKIKEAAAQEDPERAALVRAAEELGLQTQGLEKEQLKTAIHARLGLSEKG